MTGYYKKASQINQFTNAAAFACLTIDHELFVFDQKHLLSGIDALRSMMEMMGASKLTIVKHRPNSNSEFCFKTVIELASDKPTTPEPADSTMMSSPPTQALALTSPRNADDGLGTSQPDPSAMVDQSDLELPSQAESSIITTQFSFDLSSQVEWDAPANCYFSDNNMGGNITPSQPESFERPVHLGRPRPDSPITSTRGT
jgi:hypothetical protein